MSGSIVLVCGPMFSGKSTEMIRLVQRHHLCKLKCVYIKHQSDNRYEQNNDDGQQNKSPLSTQITTHDGNSVPALKCEKLFDLETQCLDSDVVGIDEGQFFDDLLPFCTKMRNLGKKIIVSALSGNFERKMFTPIVELIPHSDRVQFFQAICLNCGSEAAYNRFKKNVKSNSDSSFEPIIGGAEMFESVCNNCW